MRCGVNMLKIYNSLTSQKEIFTPIVPGKISMYVCGVTVYDYCHLGHAKTYTAIDTIVNYLKWRGFEVNHVRNITDIDDKIIQRANEKQVSIDSITQQFTQAMHEDFAALGLSLPTHEPRATEYIDQMISLIERLIEKNYAYVADNGDVYFEIRKLPHYGCLSHHDIDQLESGSRVEVSQFKRDPLDFVLWKLAKDNEPFWESPWGKGRPGWHTECVAMSLDLLGETFDIHAGGKDLIFPHHENELAQAKSLSAKNFANIWIHGGFLQIGKDKMSKSLQNFVTIRELLNDYDSEVLRYFLTASHYRSQLIFTTENLAQVQQALNRFYTALRFLPQEEAMNDSSFEKDFIAAMDDDFNTPVALAVLFELAHEIQRVRDTDIKLAGQYGALLKKLSGVLGILQTDPEQFFQVVTGVDVEKITALIAARNAARQEKNWQAADKIRDELLSLNVVIEDTATGTVWKKSS